MKLYSYYVYKNEKRYVNFELLWLYENKVFHLRVMPCFLGKDWNILIALSKRLKTYEECETDFLASCGR